MPLWKQHHSGDSQFSSPSIPAPESHPIPAATEALPRMRPVMTSEHATLTREVVIHGQISGSDALFLDGLVEGSISIPDERVTIGPNGRVHAPAGQSAPCITGREVVVLGYVEGSIYAEEKVEIRANGSVTGEISTVRISIEDGAYFRGGIDIRKPKQPVQEPEAAHLAGAAV